MERTQVLVVRLHLIGQRGVSGRLYDRGRYSPARETGVHHFHRLLAEYMNLGVEGAEPLR